LPPEWFYTAKMSRGSSDHEFFGDFLIKFMDTLEHNFPYGELIGQLLKHGMVSKWQYHRLESFPNIMKQRRETVMLVSQLPPEKVEHFCYLIKENPPSKKLGKELLKGTLRLYCT